MQEGDLEQAMSQVVAGLYEIQYEIGSGGGGIVYLGRHQRLNKQVVLKADKRKLTTATEVLRREVDLLKGLSQTYIPQVYDFVQEDGVVYTIMDYIEGESLDKILARGQKLEQAQVIRWACQLLEALQYLHSQPPYGILHGDIKPANIMVRPNGDICLIDYNIALALGEDGAVKVGFSRGYASPEHYNADYLLQNKAAAVGVLSGSDVKRRNVSEDETQTDNDETQTDEDETLTDDSGLQSEAQETLAESGSSIAKSRIMGKTGTGSGKKGGMLLDVRSDIYSLGATLYHLLSGTRPAQNAREVVPLDAKYCSPAVSLILQKAMSPYPEKRYQTAEEMLDAFRQLHRRDARVVRHKRRMTTVAVMLSLLFLTGGTAAFVGLKQLEQRQNALALAEYSANALAKGDISGAIELALQAIPEDGNIFNAPVTAEAQKALTDALGVYDLSDGYKLLGRTELPAAPFKIVASPEGKRFAVVYAYEMAVYEAETNERITALRIQESALSDVVFVDEDTLIYAGDGGITAYDLEHREILWSGETATMLSLSQDRKMVAAVDRTADHAVIYCAADGSVAAECSFGGKRLDVPVNDIFADARDSIFALNENGTMLAASFSDGGLRIFDLLSEDDDIIIYDESDYQHFEGGFSGGYFTYAANKSGDTFFGIVDLERVEYIGMMESQDDFHVQTDHENIYLSNANLLVRFDSETMEEVELAYTKDVNITGFSAGKEYCIVATDNNCYSFYDSGANLMAAEAASENCDFTVMLEDYAVVGNRNEPAFYLIGLENHEDATLLSYDAHYEHSEARISQDEKTVMLFDYRGFRIYDIAGDLLMETVLPDAEYIYDQQYRKREDEAYLEVIWYDGTVRCYSAEDGSLISEERKEAPDTDLYEEFYTDRYRVASSLHEAPKVYALESEELVAVLESESYLTYVTQAGDYLITEYISAEGERYGLILNEHFETLAYLPGLCDITEEYLVFDYKSGNLRHSRLYSLQELIDLGESYITNRKEN